MFPLLPDVRIGLTGRRPGFTLIELLVVIAIIGVLIALLSPAVQQAREAARRAACMNHLRQTGLALHLYQDVQGSLPLAYAFGSNADGEYLQQSWTKQILPHLEQQNLFDEWDASYGFAQGTNRDLLPYVLPVYRCPSSPAADVERFDLAGFPPADTTDPRGPLFDAAVVDYFAISEFVGPSARRFGSGLGMLPYPTRKRQRPFRLHDVFDGLSNTLMVAECVGGSQVYRAGGVAADKAQTSAQGHWAARNRISLRRYDESGKRWLGGYCLINCTNENGANLYGRHPGGVQVLAGDGSCRFLSSATDFDTIARLCVVDDGQVIGEY